MSGAESEWVKSAMTDDNMVAELLFRLHRTAAPPHPPPKPVLEWSVRQRRSKSASSKRNKAIHRGSPTTPLSWSGGATSEDSTPPPPLLKPSKTPRSIKLQVNCDSDKTSSKRSRKKKTFAELKEEETMLIKERKELNKEITVLRRNLEKQRATNESFKKMKLELQPEMDRRTVSLLKESISDQSTPFIRPPIASGNVISLQPSGSNVCPEQHEDESSDHKFALPDLNIPFEDSAPDAICGVS